ncbi:hypothetical protein MPSEU_000773700 [Mayamaea pseudoterrestris]|nr:hypothetical protein MPSEU_000773700 [Mayamaea pseudoterrestris]
MQGRSILLDCVSESALEDARAQVYACALNEQEFFMATLLYEYTYDKTHGTLSRNSATEDSGSDDEQSVDPAEAMLQRGSRLRQLRLMEHEDEAARRNLAHQDEIDEQANEMNDGDESESIVLLIDQSNLFIYESFLRHQRVYDDLKHVDYKYIDYSNGCYSLIVEQDKSLGKGGFCWDAAFILGEYLSSQENGNVLHDLRRDAKSGERPLDIVELGAGTGLCGMMVAKALTDVHVTLTDLGLLMPLLKRNLSRNFAAFDERTTHSSTAILDYMATIKHDKSSKGSVSSAVLDWDQESHNASFDLVIAADVVATLYDPSTLARTIHSLANVAVISFKERLSSVHREFEAQMANYYESIEIIQPTGCRNLNTAVKILIAKGRK